MSKRPNPGRIPVFGSRIPVPGQIQTLATTRGNLADVQLTPTKSSNEVSSKDLGRKVRVADKEGVLRFVGNVHFAPGVWCGVELSSAVGKNDGCIRGVRYFACPESCGLMAPHSKVSLIDEIAEDAASGPYSMIFDVNDQLVNNKIAAADNRSARKIIRSQTFDKSEPIDNLQACKRQGDKGKSYRSTQINCDTTIVKVPKELDSSDSLNHTGSSNETIINISITNTRRTYMISHKDRSVLNTTDPNRTFTTENNITFDLTTDPKANSETTKHKAPSQLNLRGVNCNSETLIVKNAVESEDFHSPVTSFFSGLNKVTHSTPIKNETNSPKKSPARHSNPADDDGAKRDSLDFDESLGILTPDQMIDQSCFPESRSPSSENIQSLPNDLNVVLKFQTTEGGDMISPSLVDGSLGLIDEQLLSPFTMISDTTMNMELPLDTENKSKNFAMPRIDQTPSPEELPLDPTPTVESEPKTESSQSKTTSNFITSVTSITSIDTGYQGDGEMSRPASRGADNSPLTRRPLPRPQPRRPDPMTDSDFYTESDADNHEEHPLRGDRRAQVIDGTLYGVDPQAAADIYVNNRENMDSSGIFTDIESNTRAEESNQNPTLDASPSDSSTKTLSDNSQNNVALITKAPSILQVQETRIAPEKEVAPKRNSPSPSTVTSSPTSIRSPKHALSKDDSPKKYKMPKRNVASKVKAMMEPNNNSSGEKKFPVKKIVGRWDAVMNKISKNQGEQIKTNLREIKSKVFTTTTTTTTSPIERNETRKTPVRPTMANQKTPNNKLRRVRTRAATNVSQTKNATTNIESSIHSSFSDLSAASPVKNIIGSAKKQREVLRVTQVLTAAKLSPKPNNHSTNEVAKKTSSTLSPDVKANNKKNIFTTKEKKKDVIPKECGRTTVKGGRVSPGTRPPQQPQQLAPVKSAPRTAEALAVLVQHLVFNLEAFRVPSLKKEVTQLRFEAEGARLSCQQFQAELSEGKLQHAAALELERNRFRTDVTALLEQHQNTIAQLKTQHLEVEQRLKVDIDDIKKQHAEQLQSVKVEFNRLQKTHAESLDILREENDAIREQIDEKNVAIDKLRNYKFESEKLKKDYEAKELVYKEQLQAANEEIARLKDENETFVHYSITNGDSSIQEVQSLRAVLELKQSEVAELRKALAEATQKADLLQIAEEKIGSLSARCEDLQSQLERKNTYEMVLMQEKKKLDDSLKAEINQKKRLKQHNEELQWKLLQNKEVVNRVLEQAEETAFNRTMLSASFSERHSRHNLERTHSFRDKLISGNKSGEPVSPRNPYDLDADECSPPSSPKVKGVVEKSDSVSYVLEMDESPDVVASRIVRRSFRNSTPPKSTPTKSPANKRPRMKNNPLSLSASASAIIPNVKSDHMRSRSVSVRNGSDFDMSGNYADIFIWEMAQAAASSSPKRECCETQSNSSYRSGGSSCKLDDNLDLDEENDVDITIPTLPSEIGRNDDDSLPVPRHLAGEAMVSESNSDDESTTSSSSGRL